MSPLATARNAAGLTRETSMQGGARRPWGRQGTARPSRPVAPGGRMWDLRDVDEIVHVYVHVHVHVHVGPRKIPTPVSDLWQSRDVPSAWGDGRLVGTSRPAGEASADPATMDHVLYFVPASHEASAVPAALEAIARRASPRRSQQIRVGYDQSVLRTLAKLRARAADALVIDARGEAGGAEESACLGLMRALFDEHVVSSPIGRERTWLVVDPDARGAALAFEAGRMRLAGVLSGTGEQLYA